MCKYQIVKLVFARGSLSNSYIESDLWVMSVCKVFVCQTIFEG